jgi:hypothetical protein
MMIRTIAIFLSLLLSASLIVYNVVLAQITDAHLRHRIGVTWHPQKRWELQARLRFDYDDFFTSFRRTNLQFNTEYKIHKGFRLGMTYRYVTSYQRDFNRFRLYATYKKSIHNKIDLSYRLMLQHDIQYLDEDFIATYQPRWNIRHRLGVGIL